jgi:predicted MPP superfamily phosphohydrolase
MGVFSIAFFGTVVTHLLAATWSLLGPTPDWLGPGLVVAVSALTVGLSVAAAIGARRPAPLLEVDVPVADLHPDLDGYRIVQLSDIHVGAPATAADLAAAVATANTGDADLIAFVGDLVDGSVDVLGDEVTALAELSARDGVYFVTGNHEYYSGAKAWERRVTELGLVVLNNTHKRVQVGQATLLVAGVTDVSAHQFVPADRSDPAGAVEGGEDADFVLLLAHHPKSIQAAARAGVDLQLSGHTHGGQFPPWTWLVPLFVPYNKGLHRHGDSWIYVSCGTGLWGPPMRLGAPAEVTAITLRRASS